MPVLQDAKLEIAYKQLGIKRDAAEAEVKSAFRKLARECHPDVSKLPKEEAERRFRAINDAYTYIRTISGW
ncbi:MAG: DnaJ domain-containing protein [Anaerolineae bacterium]|nr:DnaJ domain-containing protein [Anaerolineae bacterium]